MDAPMQPILVPTGARRRRRRLRLYSVTALAGLTMLVTQCAPQQCAPAPAPASTSVLQQIVDLTNQQRTARGLAPLAMNGQLNSAALRMSNDMAAHNTIQPGGGPHQGSDGTDPGARISAAGYAWRAWGENIAAGQPDASSVVQAWMSSKGHRDNILNPNVAEIGVALAYSPTGTPYWTQDFAAHA